MPEEEAFAVLVKLMQDYRLRELFKPSMAELGLCMYKLECLIQVCYSEIHRVVNLYHSLGKLSRRQTDNIQSNLNNS